MDARPTVGDLGLELEDYDEEAEVRAQLGSDEYEIVGVEFDEESNLVFINLGAKVTRGSD